MRKINIILSALVLTSAMPAFAEFCTSCGQNLPDGANFCPGCGTAASSAFESAAPEGSAVETATTNTNTIVTTVDPQLVIDNQSLADYNFINRIESLLTDSTSNVALRQCQELKRQNANKMQALENSYINYSPYRRKIHDLHMKKLEALENYLEARRNADRGSDIARQRANMDKQAFIIDKMNEAIDMLLTNGNSLVNLNKVEDLEKRVKKTTANYIVTSQYLTLGNVRVKRNEPIWIEDVSGASARVHHMGSNEGDEPAVGNVSIYDLEKRSNWTADGAFFYSSPSGTTVVYSQVVRPEPSVNVVVWDGIYPYRRGPFRPIWGHGPHVPPPPSRRPTPPRPAPAPHKPAPRGGIGPAPRL